MPRDCRLCHAVWIMAIIPLVQSCRLMSTARPASVPAEATAVTFSKEGGWAYCWFDAQSNVDRGRTYSANGHRLYRPGRENDDDDVFLRDDGGPPLRDNELKINRARTSPGHIWLDNGVVMLPRNEFELYKQLVDRIKAAAGRRQKPKPSGEAGQRE